MLRDLLATLADIFLPPACPVCGRLGDGRPCAACNAQLPPVPSPRCPVCGVPFPNAAGPGHCCPDCLRERFSFDQAASALLYDSAVPALVRAFKYQRNFTVLPLLAERLRSTIPASWPATADVIVPVPLHPSRLRQRTYNQALLLARRAYPDRNKIIDPFLLVRIRPTPSQVGQSGTERRRALRDAFAVTAPSRVQGKTVLLIDDVLTTGATANECARVLRRAGATRILVATLARVATPG